MESKYKLKLAEYRSKLNELGNDAKLMLDKYFFFSSTPWGISDPGVSTEDLKRLTERNLKAAEQCYKQLVKIEEEILDRNDISIEDKCNIIREEVALKLFLYDGYIALSSMGENTEYFNKVMEYHESAGIS